MKKGQRPQEHKRLMKTKRGKRSITINKGIKKKSKLKLFKLPNYSSSPTRINRNSKESIEKTKKANEKYGATGFRNDVSAITELQKVFAMSNKDRRQRRLNILNGRDPLDNGDGTILGQEDENYGLVKNDDNIKSYVGLDINKTAKQIQDEKREKLKALLSINSTFGSRYGQQMYLNAVDKYNLNKKQAAQLSELMSESGSISNEKVELLSQSILLHKSNKDPEKPTGPTTNKKLHLLEGKLNVLQKLGDNLGNYEEEIDTKLNEYTTAFGKWKTEINKPILQRDEALQRLTKLINSKKDIKDKVLVDKFNELINSEDPGDRKELKKLLDKVNPKDSKIFFRTITPKRVRELKENPPENFDPIKYVSDININKAKQLLDDQNAKLQQKILQLPTEESLQVKLIEDPQNKEKYLNQLDKINKLKQKININEQKKNIGIVKLIKDQMESTANLFANIRNPSDKVIQKYMKILLSSQDKIDKFNNDKIGLKLRFVPEYKKIIESLRNNNKYNFTKNKSGFSDSFFGAQLNRLDQAIDSNIKKDKTSGEFNKLPDYLKNDRKILYTITDIENKIKTKLLPQTIRNPLIASEIMLKSGLSRKDSALALNRLGVTKNTIIKANELLSEYGSKIKQGNQALETRDQMISSIRSESEDEAGITNKNKKDGLRAKQYFNSRKPNYKTGGKR